MGIDICDKNLKAWALVVDQEQVGWIAACFNSQKCIRIRGIIIRKDKRNLGYGQQMISKLILTYEKKPEFILFCTEAMISYYEKFGFKKVDDFIPRPVEVYDASTKEYSVRCLEKLCLMRFLNKS